MDAKGDVKKGGDDGSASAPRDNSDSEEKFECNICFDTPTDPVVTLWPCIREWMVQKGESALCPVCKEKCVPLYGRGSKQSADPRDKAAHDSRPRGQRTPAPQGSTSRGGYVNQGFPFGMPFDGSGGDIQFSFGGRSPTEVRATLSRVIMTVGMLFLFYIILLS